MELQTRKDLLMLGCIARPLCNAVQLTKNPLSQEVSRLRVQSACSAGPADDSIAILL